MFDNDVFNQNISPNTFIPLHKKWSCSFEIFSVNATKSAGQCRFSHIYWRNHEWKTSFFVQCLGRKIQFSGEFQPISFQMLAFDPVANVSFQGEGSRIKTLHRKEICQERLFYRIFDKKIAFFKKGSFQKQIF